jgi:hypothetical protein
MGIGHLIEERIEDEQVNELLDYEYRDPWTHA